MAATYPPPLDQLLTLGQPDLDEWLDYRALGLGDEHVFALSGLLQDPRLSWIDRTEGDDETPYWAPAHAWRALGQLRAHEAAEALVGVVLRDDEDEWALEEIPEVLGMIGPAALPAIRDALPTAGLKEEPWTIGSLGNALRNITAAPPEARDEAVALLTRQLREWPEQDGTLNAFLSGDLPDLRAVEAAPVMREAFEGDAVDEAVVGDWEDVQVALGLLAGRTTPRPRSGFGVRQPFHDPGPVDVRPARHSTKAAAKARNRRKAAKQSRKKNRRRR